VITAALGGIDAAAERARAEELVRAKLRRETLSGDDVRITRRLVGMLARRGYSQNLACEVVLAELSAERERRRV
jgi:regulatory protein